MSARGPSARDLAAWAALRVCAAPVGPWAQAMPRCTLLALTLVIQSEKMLRALPAHPWASAVLEPPAMTGKPWKTPSLVVRVPVARVRSDSGFVLRGLSGLGHVKAVPCCVLVALLLSWLTIKPNLSWWIQQSRSLCTVARIITRLPRHKCPHSRRTFPALFEGLLASRLSRYEQQ